MAIDPWSFGHVALTGRAQSGKDTAATALELAGWKRAAFADPLKAMALSIDPIVEVHTHAGTSFLHLTKVVRAVGWDEAKRHGDVRRFLQRLGTNGVRDHLGRDVWVDATMARVEVPTVFTDVRFPNEADAVRARGGIVVRIVRREIADVPGHVSESAMDGYAVDATITNDGTVDGLHLAVRRLVATSVAPAVVE